MNLSLERFDESLDRKRATSSTYKKQIGIVVSDKSEGMSSWINGSEGLCYGVL